MGPFCGWEMPIDYPEGVIATHLHTRNKAGLFDVSHMGQLEYATCLLLRYQLIPAAFSRACSTIRLHGKDRTAFLESLVVADLQKLGLHQTRLSCYTNEKGGIKVDFSPNDANVNCFSFFASYHGRTTR